MLNSYWRQLSSVRGRKRGATMEKNYVKPNMEILETDFDDVIMTSISGLPNDDHPGDNEVELGM